MHCKVSSVARLLHLPQFLLEVRDLVPEPGGQFELELRRRMAHLLVHLLDQLHKILGGSGREAVLANLFRRGQRGVVLLGLRVLGLLALALDRCGVVVGGGPLREQLLGVLFLARDLVGDVGDLLAQRRAPC